MRRPRFSIAWLMVLVAVVAINWAAMRAGMNASDWIRMKQVSLYYTRLPVMPASPVPRPIYAEHIPIIESVRIYQGLVLLTFAVPPMASLLGLGVILSLRGLGPRGHSSPWLFGFVVAGSAATIAVVTCCLLTDWMELYAEAVSNRVVVDPVIRLFGDRISDEVYMVIGGGTAILVLAGPPALIAVLGGYLNEKVFRVALTVVPRTVVVPEAALGRDSQEVPETGMT